MGSQSSLLPEKLHLAKMGDQLDQGYATAMDIRGCTIAGPPGSRPHHDRCTMIAAPPLHRCIIAASLHHRCTTMAAPAMCTYFGVKTATSFRPKFTKAGASCGGESIAEDRGRLIGTHRGSTAASSCPGSCCLPRAWKPHGHSSLPLPGTSHCYQESSGIPALHLVT